MSTNRGMNRRRVRELLEIVEDAVSAPGLTWQEKKALVLEEANADQELALSEFSSWFAGE